MLKLYEFFMLLKIRVLKESAKIGKVLLPREYKNYKKLRLYKSTVL